MESIKKMFLNNAHIYHSHHLHLTIDPTVKLTPEQQSKCTRIILPEYDPITKKPTYRLQVLTTIKIANIAQFEKEISLFENLSDKILGWKLEGVVTKYTPLKAQIKDFCYYELHTSTPDKISDPDFTRYWSYSLKNQKYISAERIFDVNAIRNEPKYEVCYYDDWPVQNVEGVWKSSLGEHFQIFDALDMDLITKIEW